MGSDESSASLSVRSKTSEGSSRRMPPFLIRPMNSDTDMSRRSMISSVVELSAFRPHPSASFRLAGSTARA